MLFNDLLLRGDQKLTFPKFPKILISKCYFLILLWPKYDDHQTTHFFSEIGQINAFFIRSKVWSSRNVLNWLKLTWRSLNNGGCGVPTRARSRRSLNNTFFSISLLIVHIDTDQKLTFLFKCYFLMLLDREYDDHRTTQKSGRFFEFWDLKSFLFCVNVKIKHQNCFALSVDRRLMVFKISNFGV